MLSPSLITPAHVCVCMVVHVPMYVRTCTTIRHTNEPGNHGERTEETPDLTNTTRYKTGLRLDTYR